MASLQQMLRGAQPARSEQSVKSCTQSRANQFLHIPQSPPQAQVFGDSAAAHFCQTSVCLAAEQRPPKKGWGEFGKSLPFSHGPLLGGLCIWSHTYCLT